VNNFSVAFFSLLKGGYEIDLSRCLDIRTAAAARPLALRSSSYFAFSSRLTILSSLFEATGFSMIASTPNPS
jgi:hypothetical protein